MEVGKSMKSIKPLDRVKDRYLHHLKCPHIGSIDETMIGKERTWIRTSFYCKLEPDITSESENCCSLEDYYEQCPYGRRR